MFSSLHFLAADCGAAIWAASMFSSLSIRHNMIDFSLKRESGSENILNNISLKKIRKWKPYVWLIIIDKRESKNNMIDFSLKKDKWKH